MAQLTSWLLKETVGVTLFDKFILISFKLLYLSIRFLLTIVLGKRRRDNFYIEKRIGFNSFLYNIIKKFGLYEYLLLQIEVPKYQYVFFCRVNNEDFTFMTGHEDEVLPYFKPNYGDIVIDVGSHIGHHTLRVAKQIGPKGRVIAIEADPNNYKLLNKNINLNRLNNVITINCAVSSKEGKIRLFTPEKDSGNTIYNTIMSNRVDPKEKFIEVNANTLDNILHKNEVSVNDINWIKIDVEGAEYEVLKGAHNILSESRNITLIIEIHSSDLYKSIVKFLEFYNFKIEFEKGGGEWRHIITRKYNEFKG